MKIKSIYLNEIISYIFQVKLDEQLKIVGKCKKVKISNKTPTYQDLIFYHIKQNNFEAVKEIIESNNIFINQEKNIDGETFLSYAMQYGRYKITKYLIDKGANKLETHIFHKTNTYGESCNTYISYKFFYLVWKNVNDLNFVKEELFKENFDFEPLISLLIRKKENFLKVKFLVNKFGDEFIKLAYEHSTCAEIPMKTNHLLCGKYKTESYLKKKIASKKTQQNKKILKI